MLVVPFVLAALVLLWTSFTGSESFSVFVCAFLGPIIAVIVLCFTWKWTGLHTCRSVRAKWVNVIAGVTCLVIFVSVPLTHWPLRLAYILSRPSFEALAQSLQTGTKYPHSMRVGAFYIKKAEIYNIDGKICLWTDLSPSGKTGFTRCPSNDLPFNLWSSLKLDGDWQFVSED
ncbi:hypothetical protein IAD21_02813 [Abditibacteriota bacterium]|nr:hypothetical protein IAD21_02813 [Abditibacteriota bacterium]